MSAFAGIISADGAPPDRQLLERIATHLALRGPDGTHISTQPGAGFCFTLLRTGPAPQCSTQPYSLDGRVWLVGDIRLDARDDLRRQLEQAGESLPPAVTDEELVLRAWRQRGEDSLGDLLGDFAFALWDAESRFLLCVRDLLGLKPFFYVHAAGRIFFSNSLDVLRLVPEVSSTLDPIFIADFLLQDWSANAERTVFRDIRRLPPGHTLQFSREGVSLRRHTTLPIEEPLDFRRPQDCVEQFRSLLDQAIRDRLPHGPVAIFMSGGLDSTSIAALAVAKSNARRQPLDLRAYTVDCKPLFHDDEDHYAALVARKFAIPLDVMSPATSLPYENFASLHLPEPSHEPFFNANALQYQRVAVHTRVALSGYGGDDILIGQAWPHLLYLFRRAKFATLLGAFGGYILRHRRIPPPRAGFRARLVRWMGRVHPTEEFPPWLAPSFVQCHHLRDRWELLQQSEDSPHPVHPAGYAGLCSNFWAATFEQEDSAFTGLPLELRAPFLDQRILRFLLRLPPVPWCMDKELLRLATHDLLPEAVRTRPKAGIPEDPLRVFARSGRWTPALEDPTKCLREFVDCPRLSATLQTSSDLWIDLRPVSLDYWLKTIENQGRIR